MKRRSFFNLILGFCTTAVSAIVGLPVLSVFFDPARKQTVRRGDKPHEFEAVESLPIDIPRKREIIQKGTDAWDRSDPKPVGAVWLVRRKGNTVDAFSVACPHLGCATGFNSEKNVFFCPCHDSAFSLEDGKTIFGPAPRGLDPLPVKIEEGKILVTFKKFIQGITSRKEA
ncbi:MAG: Rieske 2Fe-2S domain-containing protein [Deltaproteobacteria bacterium]|nr:Rieske 2Fe-2S domain-containing protein [Deltaproteobacteria bacterium]